MGQQQMTYFKNFFTVFDQPVFVIKSGEIIDCNPAALDFFGVKNKFEVIGSLLSFISKSLSPSEDKAPAFWSFLNQESVQVPLFQFLNTVPGPYYKHWIECKRWKTDDKHQDPTYFLFFRMLKDEEISLQHKNSDKIREQLLASMIELAPELIMKYDNKGMIVYCNTMSKELTGQPWDYFVGKITDELTKFPQRLIDHWNQILSFVYKEKITKRDEFIMPNGIWLDCICTPDLDADGNVKEIAVYSRNITEMKNIQDELYAYKNKLEHLVEKRTNELLKNKQVLSDALAITMAGVWEYDFETKIFSIDDRVCDIYGIKKTSISAFHKVELNELIDLVHPDDLSDWIQNIEWLRKSKPGEILKGKGHRIVLQDGSVKYVYSNIRILPHKTHSESKILRGVVNDITHLKSVEFERNRLIQIIEATPDIIAIATKEHEVLFLNKAGKQFFGYSNLPFKPSEISDEEVCGRLCNPKELEAAAINGFWVSEKAIERYDGKKIPVSQVIVAHYLEGKARSFSTIVRDISDQKKVEEDLKFKKKELDTFIYKASHDLKGPVASMMGLNLLIEKDVKEQAAKEYFYMYREEVNKLHNILLSLIELTEIKDKDLQKQEMDFATLLGQVVQGLDDKLVQNVEFRFKVNLKKPYYGDSELFHLFFTNLIQNAVTFKNSNVASYVKVEINNRKDNLLIRVEDNGMGIHSQIQDKVFQMFYRGSEYSKGQGLGLYLVRNIVDKLHGNISLESTHGKGTTFIFRFPIENHTV